MSSEERIFLNVTVTDPLKQSDSFGSYIIYKVNTSTNSPEYSFSQFSVLRRYSDFVWLNEQLNFFYPGTIVPPLPEKQSVGRFTPEFVESRRRGIEKFMSRVTKHEILKVTPVLATFLQADDAAFALCKEQYKQDRAAASGGMANWLESKLSALSSSSANVERTAADVKFDEVMKYIIQLETQMQNVAKHTSSLVKQNRAMANALFEFGQAFTWLGQSEGDGLGAALTQVGNTADQLSVLATENAEAEAVHLEEPLEEYVRLLAAVKAALKRRQEKKTIHLNAISDLDSKQNSYNKLMGTPGKEAQATAKLEQVERCREYVEKTRVEYEDVSENLLIEFERFKVEKAEDIKQILLNYVKLQIEFNKKSEQAWKDLIPHLKTISTSNNSSVSRVAASLLSSGPESSSQVSHSQKYDEEDMPPPVPPKQEGSNFTEVVEDEDEEVGV